MLRSGLVSVSCAYGLPKKAGFESSEPMISSGEKVLGSSLSSGDQADVVKFPPIDLSVVGRLRNLKQLATTPAAKAICAIFGARSVVGYTPGTCRVSVTIPLPLDSSQANIEAISEGMTEDIQLVARVMLGLVPDLEKIQQKFEDIASQNGYGSSSSNNNNNNIKNSPSWASTTTPSSEGENNNNNKKPIPFVCNALLEMFARQTGAAITALNFDWRIKTARVSLSPLEEVMGVSAPSGGNSTPKGPFTSRVSGMLRFGSAFSRVCGFDLVSGECGEALCASRRESFAADLVREFWQALDLLHGYHPSQQLMDLVSPVMLKFFRSGMRDDGTFCSSGEPLALYLHGTAGVGKSSFVKGWCSALETVIQRRFDAELPVRIVKVLLNSMTPGDLARSLRVKGISDMSIERIVEQTVWKGGVVLLHLEELPGDGELQQQLLSKVDEMLASVRQRYPKEASNILSVVTSNHTPACAAVSDRYAVIATLEAPTADMQHEWCERMLGSNVDNQIQSAALEAAIAAAASAMSSSSSPSSLPPPDDASASTPSSSSLSTISPSSSSSPPAAPMVPIAPVSLVELSPPLVRHPDMRPLEQLWKSIGYHTAAHIIQCLNNNNNSSSAKKSDKMVDDDEDVEVDEEAVDNIDVSTTITNNNNNALLFSLPSNISIRVHLVNKENDDLSIPKSAQIEIELDYSTRLPVLHLASADGFFYYDQSATTSNNISSEESLGGKSTSSDTQARLCAVACMLRDNYLRPAVVVVHGEKEEDRTACTRRFLSHLQHTLGDKMRETEVELRQEEDKDKVFGPPTQILGGLFRFIDSNNNRNVVGQEVRYCVITAYVNEIGQFILREVLEPGQSRTHRQAISKDRVLFLLQVDGGAEITPQLRSRSILVVEC